LKEVASFGTGIGLLIAETTHTSIRLPVLLIAGLLAGLPVASVLDRVLAGIR
jgi:hypothetical protein